MDQEQYYECISVLGPEWENLFVTSSLDKKLQYCLNQISRGDISQLCPRYQDILNAFKLCPLHKLKVIIIGQGPYCTYDSTTLNALDPVSYDFNVSNPELSDFAIIEHIPHADGLCFSTRSNKTPQTLKNLFDALKVTGCMNKYPEYNSLEKWAVQGVLLLNTHLTTVRGKPDRHLFWVEFITEFVKYISRNPPNTTLIFMLWGADAKRLRSVINPSITRYANNIVLTYTHPDPLLDDYLSYNKRFHNCNHFNTANTILSNNNLIPIEWDLNVEIAPQTQLFNVLNPFVSNSILITDNSMEIPCSMLESIIQYPYYPCEQTSSGDEYRKETTITTGTTGTTGTTSLRHFNDYITSCITSVVDYFGFRLGAKNN